MRDYVNSLLSREYEVVTVGDGEAALAEVRRNPPDLLLSDIMMPRLDGLGLLRALRGDPATREIPVILLSARAGEESRVEGLEQGADDYLVKPFSARELVARVAARIALARLRREMAERHIQERLRHAEAELARISRLTTMGQLTASIAHEINQPLSAIVTNADACLHWLARDEPDLDEVRNAISRIGRDGTRAGDVVRGLRALSARSEPNRARLDLNDAIQEVLALARSEMQRHRVHLRTDMFAGDRPVFGDRVQLQQVVLNLVMNAIEAMSAVTDRQTVLAISSEPAESDGMIVSIEDTGAGLDPAIADRIFDPFFTTKPNGMGMGLSICRSIIQAHGGRCWASPRAPHGTAFRFTVPTAAEIPGDVQHAFNSQD